jgi:hypothetical protein
VNADGSRTGNGVNITGGVAQSQAVAFTGIDQAFYSNLAAQDGRVFNQATTLAGNIDNILGNVRNGVVFVNGDLHISGTYNQNLTFVATGNIFIDGDLTPPGGITPVGTAAAAQLGLLSVSNVIIPENAPQNINIEAYVLAERGQFTAAGTNAKGTLTFRGSMAVGSNPIAVSAIDLNTYVTRNFQYNDSFANNNLAIPSLQSIVNVVDWNEI